MAARRGERAPETAVPKKKASPDPTLLAEVLGLRSIVVNLLSAVAVDLPKETVQRIVAQADSIKRAKAEEMLRRLEDDDAPKTEGK